MLGSTLGCCRIWPVIVVVVGKYFSRPIKNTYAQIFLMKSLGLEHYCDGFFYSAALSCRKPSLDFYKEINELSGFLPEELLLIDYTQANVQAARESGWNAIYCTRSSDLEAQICDLQVIGKDTQCPSTV